MSQSFYQAPVSPSRFIEMIEPRLMASASYWTGTSLSAPTGSYFAEVLAGDNGNPWGTATAVSGAGDDQQAWSYPEWDDDTSDHLDSSWQSLDMQLNTGSVNQLAFTVSGDSQSFSTSTLTVHQVTIIADVDNSGMKMAFQNLEVDFIHNGSVVEQDYLSNFAADTLTQTSGSPAEAGVVVTPTASNITGVRVTGGFRMQTASGTYAGGTDIFGQIVVS